MIRDANCGILVPASQVCDQNSGGCHAYLRNVSGVTHDVGSVIISTNGKATPMGRNFGTLVVDKSVKKISSGTVLGHLRSNGEEISEIGRVVSEIS